MVFLQDIRIRYRAILDLLFQTLQHHVEANGAEVDQLQLLQGSLLLFVTDDLLSLTLRVDEHRIQDRPNILMLGIDRQRQRGRIGVGFGCRKRCQIVIQTRHTGSSFGRQVASKSFGRRIRFGRLDLQRHIPNGDQTADFLEQLFFREPPADGRPHVLLPILPTDLLAGRSVQQHHLGSRNRGSWRSTPQPPWIRDYRGSR